MNSPVNFKFVAFSEPGTKLHQQSCFADYISLPGSTNHHITEASRFPQTCPPGFVGVHNFLSDPEDDEHEEMLEWLGGKYEPQEFAPEKVKFDNPTKRWKLAFSEGQ